MYIERGRPVIEPDDNFVALANALRESIPVNNRTGAVSPDEGWWGHVAENEAEALEGHFFLLPDDSGHSVQSWLTPSADKDCHLTLGTTALEQALVVVGLERVDTDRDASDIDVVLRALDAAKQRS